jgi:hypothetical protein
MNVETLGLLAMLPDPDWHRHSDLDSGEAGKRHLDAEPNGAPRAFERQRAEFRSSFRSAL